ncbi:MAG: ribosome biogenesis/translation initiation ATPase RLI [Candidatus Woesearchaeota archaeon]
MPRLAVIDNEKLKQMNDKLHIQSLCPVNRRGSDCMYFEGEKLLIDEILCIGCGICVKAAPHAISIINLPDEDKFPPIHQYGKNGFRVFNLPFVEENKIVGILGKNGIGKSTVISILAGILEANFGELEKRYESKEEYFTELFSKYKGTVLQQYFTNLQKENIKVAFKPQQIIQIPQKFKGSVISLLKNIEQDISKIELKSQSLNIHQILERDISHLSGGELQRVALCACLLKESANFFVFDEVTNYLDVYERLNSAQIIKNVVGEKSALVVEHDLVILDFLIDNIHLMYGKSGVYGKLTNIKNARLGVNEYLQGYSKDENVQFRDKPITFHKDSVLDEQIRSAYVKWSSEVVQRGEFSVEIKEGHISKGEIIGIIGRNALGKSTFMNHVNEVGLEDKIISYKEQLIQRSDDLVLSVLGAMSHYTDPFFKLYILEPLKIEELEEKQVDQLSGGELQRFAIAKCLLEDAQVYLLDEPTAFLDVEDRLVVAKVIRNFIELREKACFVIDHDLIFMDYISHRLMVFDGQPSIQGVAHSPVGMREGMNHFLKGVDITFRREEHSKRPRINKKGSVKDNEQKKAGEYYYS